MEKRPRYRLACVVISSCSLASLCSTWRRRLFSTWYMVRHTVFLQERTAGSQMAGGDGVSMGILPKRLRVSQVSKSRWRPNTCLYSCPDCYSLQSSLHLSRDGLRNLPQRRSILLPLWSEVPEVKTTLANADHNYDGLPEVILWLHPARFRRVGEDAEGRIASP